MFAAQFPHGHHKRRYNSAQALPLITPFLCRTMGNYQTLREIVRMHIGGYLGRKPQKPCLCEPRTVWPQIIKCSDALCGSVITLDWLNNCGSDVTIRHTCNV